MKENELRSLAMAARENLAGWIADEEERQRTDEKLRDALALRTGAAAIALRLALMSHEATRRFLQAGADAAPEPDAPDTIAPGPDRVPGLGGNVVSIIGTWFVCPEGDYDEVRETLADGTPTCPTHGPVMTRKDG